MSERQLLNDRIPLSIPEISGNEWTYVKECLDSGWVSSVGSYVTRFEDCLKSYVGTDHAIATVNGTAAIHLSLLALEVGPDDEVIVPALTFIAPVNCVRYCGAMPVFMDCDPETLCLDVKKFEEFLQKECRRGKSGNTFNVSTGRKIRAAIPVHVFGHPVDMAPLLELAKEFNFDVIEDATESLGSEYRGVKTGSLARIGCFSFNGNKIITTGGGGMVVTCDEELALKIRHLSTQARTHPIEYFHDMIGYNYRLTNIQAAVGLAQMERLDEFIAIKRNNAGMYCRLFEGIDSVEMVWEQPWAKSNFWFYTIKIINDQRHSICNSLQLKGIETRPLWKPIHSLPMYRSSFSYQIEHVETAYRDCLNIPCSVNLRPEQIEYIVSCLKESLIHGE